jgi:hypothetical protein
LTKLIFSGILNSRKIEERCMADIYKLEPKKGPSLPKIGPNKASVHRPQFGVKKGSSEKPQSTKKKTSFSTLIPEGELQVKLLLMEAFLYRLRGRVSNESIALRLQGLKDMALSKLTKYVEKSNEKDWSQKPAFYWALVITARKRLLERHHK